jgi:hypothetical protein
MKGLLTKFGNNIDRVMASNRRADYLTIKGEVERLGRDLERRKQVDIEIRSRFAKLEEELNAFDLQVSLKELLVLQDKVKEVENIFTGLNEAITSAQAIVERDNLSNTQSLVALTEERENLLADIASGEVVDKGKLEKIEKQIAIEEAINEKHVNSIITAKHTISGLNRKIASVEAELSVAKINFNTAAVSFIKTEIEKAGGEYAVLANQISDTFMRIISLAELCGNLGTPVDVFGPHTWRIKIPAFAASVCKTQKNNSMDGIIFQYNPDANKQESLQNEIERFESLGLKLLL